MPQPAERNAQSHRRPAQSRGAVCGGGAPISAQDRGPTALFCESRLGLSEFVPPSERGALSGLLPMSAAAPSAATAARSTSQGSLATSGRSEEPPPVKLIRSFLKALP